MADLIELHLLGMVVDGQEQQPVDPCQSTTEALNATKRHAEFYYQDPQPWMTSLAGLFTDIYGRRR